MGVNFEGPLILFFSIEVTLSVPASPLPPSTSSTSATSETAKPTSPFPPLLASHEDKNEDFHEVSLPVNEYQIYFLLLMIFVNYLFFSLAYHIVGILHVTHLIYNTC